MQNDPSYSLGKVYYSMDDNKLSEFEQALNSPTARIVGWKRWCKSTKTNNKHNMGTTNTTKQNLANAQAKLKNQQWASIVVNTVERGVENYCGRLLAVTDKTIRFTDRNSGKTLRTPLANVVYVS